MTDNWETSLPESLQNPEDKQKIKELITQWSRLTAWLWSSLLAFSDDDNKVTQEMTLKKVLNEILQQQALRTIAYESYDDLNAKAEADVLSGYLQEMLVGNNSAVPALQENNIKVTLAEVLKNLSDENFVLTEYPDFAKMFTCRVTPEYVGKYTEIGSRKYISNIAYPPRPVLSEYTITEQQLYSWGQNIDTQGNYLPPSLYIPIGAGS